MISTLSPIEVSLFQRKKMAQNRKCLLFGVRFAKGKKVFFFGFLILEIPDPCRNLNQNIVVYTYMQYLHVINEWKDNMARKQSLDVLFQIFFKIKCF